MRALSDFMGTWAISREIDDHLAGAKAHLTGTCRFTQHGADVIQHEVGTLMMPNLTQPMTAERRYIWRQHGNLDQGSDIHVHFDDDRFFHSFDPTLDYPQAGHDCDPDRYDVRYDFSGWSKTAPVFTVRWQVNGPRKSYVSATQFTFLDTA